MNGVIIRNQSGGGYSPVCLRCPSPQRFRIRVRWISDALHLLADHDRDYHGGKPW